MFGLREHVPIAAVSLVRVPRYDEAKRRDVGGAAITTMRLICVTLITVLALGLMTASGASAKPPVLELKEAGAPIPVGAEVTVELKLWTRCEHYSEGKYYEEPFAFHGHIAVNGARTDILTFSAQEVLCQDVELYTSYVAGSLKEISILHSGRTRINASLTFGGGREGCNYDTNLLPGKLPIPGYARFEGKARGALFEEDYPNYFSCRKRISVSFAAAVYGHNGKLLETELS
jgi:hypothetical protein